MCTHAGTWWSRKSSHMEDQKHGRILALVSSPSMSTSKYEGSLKSPQMEDKQKPEQMDQGSWCVSRCPFAYDERPGCAVSHTLAPLWSLTLSPSHTEWMPAWPGLTSLSLLPSSALTSVWNVFWRWWAIWSQTQVQTATRTCHVPGTEHDHIANLKPTQWPQFSWERKKNDHEPDERTMKRYLAHTHTHTQIICLKN